jgi:NADH-quinone oxidoreductase subunit L
MESLIGFIVFLPAIVCAILGLSWLLGVELRERTVARLTSLCYSLASIGVLILFITMLRSGQHEIRLPLGNWFEVEEYRFQLLLIVDRLSMPLVALSTVLTGVIGAFSVRYLHRDPGFLRFFILLNLFGFGVLLLFTAGTFDLVIGGWELVGLSSVLLIGFFQFRDDPIRSAIRVFLTYRVCDIGLLTGVAMLHHYLGTAASDSIFTRPWPDGTSALTGTGATVVGMLFLLGAMGKAAQIPFSGWLPRAMEGPTPSSAIFYGALSIHAGAYLLLRAQPLIQASAIVTTSVIIIGTLTAIHGTMVGRACADAKTSIGYAAMTQLGLIFVEIGLGLKWIALFHITSHAIVRTLQFLRAPSMLHDHHRIHAASGGHLGETGAHYEQLLPVGLRSWLYRLAIEQGHHDTLIERLGTNPISKLSQFFNSLETRWTDIIIGPARSGVGQLTTRTGMRTLKRSAIGSINNSMERADV